MISQKEDDCKTLEEFVKESFSKSQEDAKEVLDQNHIKFLYKLGLFAKRVLQNLKMTQRRVSIKPYTNLYRLGSVGINSKSNKG